MKLPAIALLTALSLPAIAAPYGIDDYGITIASTPAGLATIGYSDGLMFGAIPDENGDLAWGGGLTQKWFLPGMLSHTYLRTDGFIGLGAKGDTCFKGICAMPSVSLGIEFTEAWSLVGTAYLNQFSLGINRSF